ncbi:MAG TPA: T9SS type A sorting domain-containing protein [Saprospiraceae bacterium]|nr:T9SS type A sorting domain-containing protein [Saprospiraceae bacterium]
MAHVRLRDLLGRVVATGQAGKQHTDILLRHLDLPAGTYLVEMESEQGRRYYRKVEIRR